MPSTWTTSMIASRSLIAFCDVGLGRTSLWTMLRCLSRESPTAPWRRVSSVGSCAPVLMPRSKRPSALLQVIRGSSELESSSLRHSKCSPPPTPVGSTGTSHGQVGSKRLSAKRRARETFSLILLSMPRDAAHAQPHQGDSASSALEQPPSQTPASTSARVSLHRSARTTSRDFRRDGCQVADIWGVTSCDD